MSDLGRQRFGSGGWGRFGLGGGAGGLGDAGNEELDQLIALSMERQGDRLAAGNPKSEIRGPNGGVGFFRRWSGIGRANLGEKLKN